MYICMTPLKDSIRLIPKPLQKPLRPPCRYISLVFMMLCWISPRPGSTLRSILVLITHSGWVTRVEMRLAYMLA